MKVINVDSTHDYQINELNMYLKNGKDVFVLMHMAKCGPCKATVPHWKEIHEQSKLKDNEALDDIVIAMVEQEKCSQIDHDAFKGVLSFPTIKHIKNQTANLYGGDRTTEAFVNWILNILNVKESSSVKEQINVKESLKNLEYVPHNRSILSKKSISGFNNQINVKFKSNKRRKTKTKSTFKIKRKTKRKSKYKTKSRRR